MTGATAEMAVAPLTDKESGSVIWSNDLMSQKQPIVPSMLGITGRLCENEVYRIEADVTEMEETAGRGRRQEQGCVFQAKTEAAYSASTDMFMPFVSSLRDGHIVCGLLGMRLARQRSL